MQEHAAKKFGIFNAEDIEHVSINSPGDGDIEKVSGLSQRSNTKLAFNDLM